MALGERSREEQRRHPGCCCMSRPPSKALCPWLDKASPRAAGMPGPAPREIPSVPETQRVGAGFKPKSDKAPSSRRMKSLGHLLQAGWTSYPALPCPAHLCAHWLLAGLQQT